jgi:hypothetical protein
MAMLEVLSANFSFASPPVRYRRFATGEGVSGFRYQPRLAVFATLTLPLVALEVVSLPGVEGFGSDLRSTRGVA